MQPRTRVTGFVTSLIIAAMFVGSCGSSANDPGPDGAQPRSGSVADEISLPEFGPFDTGVLSGISVATASTPSSTDGVEAQLDACEHVAPGRWVLRGDISRAPDTPGVVSMGVVFARGDIGNGVAVSATISGRGQFTLPIDLFARADTGRVAAWASDAGSCSLEPGRGAGDFADVTASDVPIDYGAPADTVQALGVGARMDRHDAKFAWAYFAWSRFAAPFENLWVPPPGPGSFRLPDFYDDNADDGAADCLLFSYSVGDTTVRQSAGCQRLVGLSDDPVPHAEGYRWQYETADRTGRSAVLVRDSFQVVVSDSNLGRLESVAASLKPIRSLVVAPDAPGPTRSFADVVEAGRLRLKATKDEFGSVGDLTERARIQRGAVTTIVFTGHFADPCDNCERGLVDYLDVYKSNGRWRFDADGGGSFDDCLSITAGASAGGGYIRAVAGDPRWTIEVLDPKVWSPVGMVNGVWIQDYPTTTNSPLPRIVVRDEQGNIVPCAQGATPAA